LRSRSSNKIGNGFLFEQLLYERGADVQEHALMADNGQEYAINDVQTRDWPPLSNERRVINGSRSVNANRKTAALVDIQLRHRPDMKVRS
jgi:hypothetical protein